MNILLINNFIVLSINELGTIIARIGQTLNMTSIFLWPYVFSRIKNTNNRLALSSFVILYLGLYYYRTWADDGVSGTAGDMLPYTFDIMRLFETHE